LTPHVGRGYDFRVFRPDPTIPFVAAAREQVVALIESINQPQISIPGKPPQAAHGHLCGVRNANGSFSAFVGLYLPESAENVVYSREPREFPREEYLVAEAEGVHFLESMGFMLDNLNFRSLAVETQESTLKRVPLFSRPKPVAPARAQEPEVTSPQRQVALARFLASF
jgi:hypothetical protein